MLLQGAGLEGTLAVSHRRTRIELSHQLVSDTPFAAEHTVKATVRRRAAILVAMCAVSVSR